MKNSKLWKKKRLVKKPIVCRCKYLLDTQCMVERDDLLLWKGNSLPSDPRAHHGEFSLLGCLLRRPFLSAFASWCGAESQLMGQKAKLSLVLRARGGEVGRWPTLNTGANSWQENSGSYSRDNWMLEPVGTSWARRQEWFSKWGPWTSNISISWELGRNADDQALPRWDTLNQNLWGWAQWTGSVMSLREDSDELTPSSKWGLYEAMIHW